MKFPWKKIVTGIKGGAQFGAMIGVPFSGALVQAMHVIEVVPGLKGPQKKEAAKALAEALIGDEGLLSRDPELAAIADRFVDDYCAIMDRLAVLRES